MPLVVVRWAVGAEKDRVVLEEVRVVFLFAIWACGDPRSCALVQALLAGCPLEVLALCSVVAEVDGREQAAAPVAMV